MADATRYIASKRNRPLHFHTLTLHAHTRFRPPPPCPQVSFLEKTSFTDEKEFLFSAYSCFKVLECKLSDDPSKHSSPHRITIEACADNREEPKNVPSAPWY